VISIQTKGRNGPVVSSVLCRDGDDALYISEKGMLVRTPVSGVSAMGRNTQGVKLVNLKADDRLVGLEIVSESDLEQYAARAADEAGAGAANEAAPETGEAPAADPPTETPEESSEESGEEEA
jgi:DNA gyrase subunit A